MFWDTLILRNSHFSKWEALGIDIMFNTHKKGFSLKSFTDKAFVSYKYKYFWDTLILPNSHFWKWEALGTDIMFFVMWFFKNHTKTKSILRHPKTRNSLFRRLCDIGTDLKCKSHKKSFFLRKYNLDTKEFFSSRKSHKTK